MRPRAGADPPRDPGAERAAAAWQDPRARLAQELADAQGAREALARRLQAVLELRRESVRQGAALDEMRRRLDLLRARADELVVGKTAAIRAVERREEQLQAQIERVLQLSRALAAAHQQVQEAKEGLSVEKARLGDLQRLLRTRQRCMVNQVAALYPVKVFREPPVAENHRSDANGEHGTLSVQNGALPRENGNGTHLLGVIKSPQVRPLTFFGWQIAKQKPKKQSYTHKELQRSAAVLGYAAHAVLLIASYLDVPLRYPLRFGGSRSYVSDRLPSAETSSVASAVHPSVGSADSKLTDYPLFLEFRDDSTRASYAIYLLHKDTEQLLNYIGAESSGRNAFGTKEKSPERSFSAPSMVHADQGKQQIPHDDNHPPVHHHCLPPGPNTRENAPPTTPRHRPHRRRGHTCHRHRCPRRRAGSTSRSCQAGPASSLPTFPHYHQLCYFRVSPASLS